MIRVGLWLLAAAAGSSGKQNGPLRIPLPFEDAIRAALEIKPKARRKRVRKRAERRK